MPIATFVSRNVMSLSGRMVTPHPTETTFASFSRKLTPCSPSFGRTYGVDPTSDGKLSSTVECAGNAGSKEPLLAPSTSTEAKEVTVARKVDTLRTMAVDWPVKVVQIVFLVTSVIRRDALSVNHQSAVPWMVDRSTITWALS